MKVYKFGGASVRSAEGVRNLAEILKLEKGGVFVVVSAMGKTTNALEKVVEHFMAGDTNAALGAWAESERYHSDIACSLLGSGEGVECVARFSREIQEIIRKGNRNGHAFEYWYDAIVSYGELLSTAIISDYLNSVGVENAWLDMRRCFITDPRHKDATIDIERSALLLTDEVRLAGKQYYVGQGFIGGTPEGETTTLGREGSDYSAAVAANILDAESLTIWKDVDGILNADPKKFPNTVHIPELTYLDAIELAYSGAQIIHPKTIKPLQNKDIPLYVRPFGDVSKPGSVIKSEVENEVDTPILILKRNQILLTLQPEDFSFVLEENMGSIFSLLDEFGVKSNLVQNSAISMSLCIDDTRYLNDIIESFRAKQFHVRYNTGMELLTIRGYTPDLYEEHESGEDVYLTQKTRRSVRIVRKSAHQE